jgi:hypothetical protein
MVNDQRGSGFTRIIGNTIDIGAFELQTPELAGDYNRNGTVDAADYVLWRKTLDASGVTPFSGADGDGNGSVQPADFNIWRSNFGQSLLGGGTGASNATSQALPVGTSVAAATSVISEEVVAVPTTANEGGDTAPSLAKPAVSSELVRFADARRLPRVRARQVAATTSAGADALAQDNALLAWLSSPRRTEAPLAEVVSSSWHSNEAFTQVDGSELDSVDEISAGLENALVMDF